MTMRDRYSEIEKHDDRFAAVCGYEAVVCDACCIGSTCREVCDYKPEHVIIEERRVAFYKEYFDYLNSFYDEA